MDLDLKIATEPLDERSLLVEVAGDVHFSNVDRLRAVLADAIAGGRQRLLVDLSRMPFMDSSGLAALIEAQREIARRDGRLLLVSGSGDLTRVLQFKGVDRLLEVRASRRDALAELA